MSNSEIYVVMSVGWEYDDNYYHKPEHGGGNPECYYVNKEDAESKCHEFNIQARSQHHPGDFQTYDHEGDEFDMNEIDFFVVVPVQVGDKQE